MSSIASVTGNTDVEMGHHGPEKNELDFLFEREFFMLKPELKDKVVEYQDAVQPHTDEGGDAYDIGDAFEPINPLCASEWRVSHPGPYLQYVKRASSNGLEYLAHWMEVTTSPLKWKFLRKYPASRAERAQRVRASVIDYSSTQLLHQAICQSATSLQQAIATNAGACWLRVIVVEDLSRDLIEVLGGHYDVDPRVFRGFINDYLFYNTRDRWAEVPSLLVEDQARPFSTFGFLRARYYPDGETFEDAERESGMFNVLRRLDGDRCRKKLQNGLLDRPGTSVTLSRSKVAIWTKPASDVSPAVAILLVDPTVTKGHPLYGGIDTTTGALSMATGIPSVSSNSCTQVPSTATLFDQVVHASAQLDSNDLSLIAKDLRCVGIPLYKIALKEWLIVIQYMNSRLALVVWEMAKPKWGEHSSQTEDVLKQLAPWWRNMTFYEKMVEDGMRAYLPCEVGGVSAAQKSPNTAGHEILRSDFIRVLGRIREIRARIQDIYGTMQDAISIEGTRRNTQAMQQSRGVTYLSVLATVFLPLNFATSFFSMSSDFSTSSNTFWLFFAFGIPLTILVVVIVWLIQCTARTRNRIRIRHRLHSEPPATIRNLPPWPPKAINPKYGASDRLNGGKLVTVADD